MSDDEARVLALVNEIGNGRLLRAFHNLTRVGLIFSHADGITVKTRDDRAFRPKVKEAQR